MRNPLSFAAPTALPWALLVCAVLSVCSCAVGPRYRRPNVPIPATWRIGSRTAGSLADEQWWDVLEDPVLQQLVRTALEHNTDIRLAASRVVQAQAQLVVTRADEFPQLSLTPSATRERISSYGQFSLPAGAPKTYDLFSLSGSASYVVDFWGAYRRATEEAQASLLASEQARRNVVIGIVSSVAQDYFQLRKLDLELAQTRATVTAYRRSLQLTQILYQGGVASELDTKQAETALDTALAEAPSLQQQITQEEDALSILLGENPQAIPRGLDLAHQPLPPSVPAGLPSQLLERRPDVLQAAQNLHAAYAAVGVAEAQFFPQLSLTGSGGMESTTLSRIITTPALMWTAVAGITQPLFEGGRLVGNFRIAKAQQQQALITYQSTVLEAFKEVDDALVAYQRSREQVTAQEALVKAEQEALHLASLRYRGGVDTYLNVLTAEQSLFSGQISLAEGRAAVLVALVQLYQALGGGWKPS